jgi:heme-degrading monooxygenase HmoA
MIARIWSGRTPASKAGQYTEYMNQTGVKDLRKTKGNRGVLMFRRAQKDIAEFTIISFWDSKESIKQFAGDDINKAVYYPEDANYLLEMEPELKHYEVPAAIGVNFEAL